MKKLAIFAALAVAGLAWLGWMPKDRADRFVRCVVGFFVIGFVVRVGQWMMAH